MTELYYYVHKLDGIITSCKQISSIYVCVVKWFASSFVCGFYRKCVAFPLRLRDGLVAQVEEFT